MRQTSFTDFNCSLAQSLELIGDWWSPMILRDIFLGIDRFDDLAKDLGISRNLLTTRLATLVEGKIVKRERYSDRPPRDRYVLTHAGHELAPIIAALTAWGDKWANRKAAPLLFKHRKCGHEMTPQVSCSHCGEALTHEDLVPIKGPGARTGPGTRLYAELFKRKAAAGESMDAPLRPAPARR